MVLRCSTHRLSLSWNLWAKTPTSHQKLSLMETPIISHIFGCLSTVPHCQEFAKAHLTLSSASFPTMSSHNMELLHFQLVWMQRVNARVCFLPAALHCPRRLVIDQGALQAHKSTLQCFRATSHCFSLTGYSQRVTAAFQCKSIGLFFR